MKIIKKIKKIKMRKLLKIIMILIKEEYEEKLNKKLDEIKGLNQLIFYY